MPPRGTDHGVDDGKVSSGRNYCDSHPPLPAEEGSLDMVCADSKTGIRRRFLAFGRHHMFPLVFDVDSVARTHASKLLVAVRLRPSKFVHHVKVCQGLAHQ